MTTDIRPDIIKDGLPPTNGLWEHEYEGVKYPHFLAADPAEHLPNIRNMRCEPDDTIICSYPRSGQYFFSVAECLRVQDKSKNIDT